MSRFNEEASHMRTLLSRLFGNSRGRVAVAGRRPRPASSYRLGFECLEGREVPSANPLVAPALGPAHAAAAPVAPAATNLLNITGIQVTGVQVTGANQLTADLNITGTLLGKSFNLNHVQVPINVSLLPQPGTDCSILHLELQIPDLNLLGLHVQLDNCMNGPVTVDLTATHEGVLGDLLCGVGGLTTDLLGQLTGPIQTVLGNVLGGLVGSTGGAAAQPAAPTHGPNTTDLVNLHLGPLDLNVLGLEVTTSAICLDITAQRGGGLLGNLLFSVNHLLDSPGNPLAAVSNLADRVLGTIGGLNL